MQDLSVNFLLKSFYQRSRPLPPPPPPPRPPRSPRSRPPPPPPPPLRSVLGRASFTLMVRPPTDDPFNAVMAFSPSSLLAISTKPNPRDRPVSRSVMMLTRSTCPNGSNSWRSSSSAVLKLRFPTKIFFTCCLCIELSEVRAIRRTWQVGRTSPENRNRSWRTVECAEQYSRFLSTRLSIRSQ